MPSTGENAAWCHGSVDQCSGTPRQPSHPRLLPLALLGLCASVVAVAGKASSSVAMSGVGGPSHGDRMLDLDEGLGAPTRLESLYVRGAYFGVSQSR